MKIFTVKANQSYSYGCVLKQLFLYSLCGVHDILLNSTSYLVSTINLIKTMPSQASNFYHAFCLIKFYTDNLDFISILV